jgi:hypothetical protein
MAPVKGPFVSAMHVVMMVVVVMVVIATGLRGRNWQRKGHGSESS